MERGKEVAVCPAPGSLPPHTHMTITMGTAQHLKQAWEGWETFIILGSRGKLVVAEVQTVCVPRTPSSPLESLRSKP